MLADVKLKKQKKTQERLVEYLKCKNDYIYFISNYILLELPGGDVKINPYDKQKELLELITDEHFVIVLKSRQIGISTILQAYITWLVIFHDNAHVGIISKDGGAATKFSRFIAGFIDKLPMWMKSSDGKDPFKKRNERSFELKNGSTVTNTPVDPKKPTNCLRGETITFLVIDECAFVEKIETAWEGMVSTIATNQKHAREASVPYGTVLLSTPNKTVGIGKFFYSRYMNAVAKNDILQPFVIHWKMVKELADDPFWYETQCRLFNNDMKKIQQELELKFLPTGGSFFDEKTNIILQDNPTDPIEIQKIFGGEIRVYERPISGRHYIIGVDTATENGEDKSAIVVLDYETMEQVWEYQSKCAITDFAKIVEVAIATYAGTLVVENSPVSAQLIEGLNRGYFHSMLYKGKLKGKAGNTSTLVPGLPVNRQTRPLIIDALYSSVTNYPTTIKSKALALELIGLVEKKSGKVEADTGCHDDLALALSFCCYVRKYDPPLMISTSGTKQLEDFGDVLNLNDDVSIGQVDNGHIMKDIKGRLDKNDTDGLGFIDIMDFYKE